MTGTICSGQFVTLGIDDEFFGIGVEEVREILDMRPVTPVPGAPAFLVGLIDVRGCSVPVVDLRAKLGLPGSAANGIGQVLVLDVEVAGEPRVLGLLIDKVSSVTALDGNLLEPPPEIGIRWRSDYIRGVGRVNGAFVIVFDLPCLLGSDETALFHAAA